MRRLIAFLALMIPPGSAWATEPLSGPDDLGRLQGRWTSKAGPNRDMVVSLEIEGKQAKIKVSLPQGDALEAEGEIRIDDRTSPKTLDWVNFTALDEQKLPDIPAIYELDGDTLRVCNGGPNNDRPREFKAGDGVLADLLTFRRADHSAAKSASRRSDQASRLSTD